MGDVDEYAMLSDEAKHEIDVKTQTLLTNAYNRAATYLRSHEQELHRLAEALVEHETLSAGEIRLAIEGNGSCIAQQRKEQAALEAPVDAVVRPTRIRKGDRDRNRDSRTASHEKPSVAE